MRWPRRSVPDRRAARSTDDGRKEPHDAPPRPLTDRRRHAVRALRRMRHRPHRLHDAARRPHPMRWNLASADTGRAMRHQPGSMPTKRRLVLLAAFAAVPHLAAAQSARNAPAAAGAALGQDFDALPAQVRERVGETFRIGSPDLGDAAIRQRWDGMTRRQREEALRRCDRDRDRDRDRIQSGVPQPRGGAAAPGPGGGGDPPAAAVAEGAAPTQRRVARFLFRPKLAPAERRSAQAAPGSPNPTRQEPGRRRHRPWTCISHRAGRKGPGGTASLPGRTARALLIPPGRGRAGGRRGSSRSRPSCRRRSRSRSGCSPTPRTRREAGSPA